MYIIKQQNSKTAKQQNNKTAKLQNSKTAKQQNSKTTKQQNNKTAKMRSCYLCREHLGKKNTPATHFCEDCEEKETGSGYLCEHCEQIAKTIQIDYGDDEEDDYSDKDSSGDESNIYEHPHNDEHCSEPLVCETCDYNISVCANATSGRDCAEKEYKRDKYTCRCGWGYSECSCIGNEPACKPEERCSKCEWPIVYCTC